MCVGGVAHHSPCAGGAGRHSPCTCWAATHRAPVGPLARVDTHVDEQLVACVERLVSALAAVPEAGEVVGPPLVDVLPLDVPHQLLLAGERLVAVDPPARVRPHLHASVCAPLLRVPPAVPRPHRGRVRGRRADGGVQFRLVRLSVERGVVLVDDELVGKAVACRRRCRATLERAHRVVRGELPAELRVLVAGEAGGGTGVVRGEVSEAAGRRGHPEGPAEEQRGRGAADEREQVEPLGGEGRCRHRALLRLARRVARAGEQRTDGRHVRQEERRLAGRLAGDAVADGRHPRQDAVRRPRLLLDGRRRHQQRRLHVAHVGRLRRQRPARRHARTDGRDVAWRRRHRLDPLATHLVVWLRRADGPVGQVHRRRNLLHADALQRVDVDV